MIQIQEMPENYIIRKKKQITYVEFQLVIKNFLDVDLYRAPENIAGDELEHKLAAKEAKQLMRASF